jgi:hypothetical protein
MTFLKTLNLIFIVFILIPLSYSKNHEKKHHKHENLSAHEHGHAQLSIVFETGSQGLLEFESPAIDVLGFEHKPSSTEEESKIKELKNIFESKAEKFFSFSPELKCSFKVKEADLEAEEHHHSDAHTKQFKKKSGEHFSFHAHYELNCLKEVQGSLFKLDLFKNYPSLETVELQYISLKEQKVQKLNSKDNSFNL